ncbi:hypothetical protein QJS10_CPA09g02059 [Acorus calamus]|uniref:SAUR family protein n=1 Tax=Acorus calamus TaxID=4465 RepID=A0AAV9EC09_ACOCL|nr:hypothetical protein QJS10_CPA09g02059 [Acorus calamus]
MMKGRVLREFMKHLKKWVVSSPATTDYSQLGVSEVEEAIPRDVPKGHLVVYVGEEQKRFVVRVGSLSHPLFKALLERAREEYEFTSDSKLWIPCDESIFVGVLRCIHSQQHQKIWFCC